MVRSLFLMTSLVYSKGLLPHLFANMRISPRYSARQPELISRMCATVDFPNEGYPFGCRDPQSSPSNSVSESVHRDGSDDGRASSRSWNPDREGAFRLSV